MSRMIFFFEILRRFWSLLACCTSNLFIFLVILLFNRQSDMVKNVADDDVEPKPTKIEASGNVKPIVNAKLKVKIHFQAHIEEKPKSVPTGVRGIEVDIGSFFL